MKNLNDTHSELKLLSRSAAASKLGIGKTNLNELIKDGRIRVVAVGNKLKISVRELNRFIDDSTFQFSEKSLSGETVPVYRLKELIPRQIRSEQKSIADNIFNNIKRVVHNGIGL